MTTSARTYTTLRDSIAGTWQHGEDVLRLARYDQPGAFAIRTASQLSFRGTEVLLDEGFIQTSDRFREFVERQA